MTVACLVQHTAKAKNNIREVIGMCLFHHHGFSIQLLVTCKNSVLLAFFLCDTLLHGVLSVLYTGLKAACQSTLSNAGSSFSLTLLAFWAAVMDAGDKKVVIQST